jgi:hypothetical protein
MLVMAARYGREDEPVTRYRRFALGVVVWVVVVTAGAALVWTVISDAGAGVAGELPTTTVTVTSTGGQPASNPPSETDTAAPSTPASGQPEQPAGPKRRSWQGAAGVVVAECQGGAISLVGAQPNSGWSIEVDHTGGPEGLRVEFESGEARVRVEASCVEGRPSFSVDTHD